MACKVDFQLSEILQNIANRLYVRGLVENNVYEKYMEAYYCRV